MRMGLVTAAAMLVSPAWAGGAPDRVGQCVGTRVAKVEQRLTDSTTNQPIPDSGSAIGFADQVYLVSYDEIDAVNRSRVGDLIRLCLVSKPTGCPAGDERGWTYRATNLRTRQSFEMPNAEHACGGA